MGTNLWMNLADEDVQLSGTAVLGNSFIDDGASPCFVAVLPWP